MPDFPDLSVLGVSILGLSVDPLLAFGGLLAGLLVGLTGMGGAALVTPMLVLVFGVPPAAAVSSDVVASAAMKPVGAFVHAKARTVHWRLVWWLSVGSIPGVLIGTWIFASVLDTEEAEETIRLWIGGVLLVAVGAMLAKNYISRRRRRSHQDQAPPALQGADLPVKIVPTVIVGALVGVLVGTTSVGSGSLVVTSLLLLYPLLRPSVLVGTDLTQAVPMLIAGALAHAGFGAISVAVVVSLLIGQIPGVWIGAKLSSSYDGHALRWLLMVILAATAVTLLGAPRVMTGAVAIVGVAIVSALIVRDRRAGQRRRALEPQLSTILEGDELSRGVDVGKQPD
ncbi:MAG TPA: sulfite exporter TauE/SafE family protein [Candidatus Nanopelagicales bacterium]|nr:sulfite exporter TauE/SafE family protein [Candidatus Nanopelagicales bacterium]